MSPDLKMFIPSALGVAAAAFFALPAFAQSATAIPGVVAAGVTPELVSDVFDNTEGPLGVSVRGPVLPVQRADDLAGGHVQGGEQRGGAPPERR